MRLSRPFQGALLALGAPIGWLAWRVAWYGVAPFDELGLHADLYLYLTLPTVIVFAAFGAFVARSEAALRRENVDLGALAVTDALTGLRNARFFHARLEQALEEAKRRSKTVSLVMLDLDHFKRVNDTHGHLVGDEVLAEVASRIKSSVRAGDTAARVGGEEFALLLMDTPVEAAFETAERLRLEVESEPFETSAGPLDITLSAGIAADIDDAPAALFAHADAALYEAKATGRNRVVAATPVSRAEEVLE